MKKAILFLGWAAILGGAAIGFAADETTEGFQKRFGEFEKSLFVAGSKEFTQRPEAEQRPIVEAFFKTLSTPAEKIAFLHMGFGRYVYAINKDVYGECAAALLKDEDVAVRKNALSGISFNKLTRYVKETAALLKDENVEVRSAAIHVLGRLEAHEYAERMEETASVARDEMERASALWGIAALLLDKKAGAEVRAKELAMLTPYLEPSAAAGMQVVALEAMLRAREAGKFESQIVKAAGHVDAQVRIKAVDVLATIATAPSTAALRARLADESREAREHAIRALENRKEKEVIDDIAKLLEDRDTGVRTKAVEALAAMKAVEKLDDVARRLKDEHEHVRGKAALAMINLGGSKYADDVAAVLSAKSGYVRADAVRSLVTIGTAKYSAVLGMMANDEEFAVRINVVRGLDKFDARDERAAVETMAKDSNDTISREAKMLLKKWDQK